MKAVFKFLRPVGIRTGTSHRVWFRETGTKAMKKPASSISNQTLWHSIPQTLNLVYNGAGGANLWVRDKERFILRTLPFLHE